MVILAAMSGAVGRDDRKPSKQKSPGHRTGARTKLTHQDQCAPTILSARYPDVATAGHAKAAVRQSATSEQRDPFNVLSVT